MKQKVILYMAISLNGMIAKRSVETFERNLKLVGQKKISDNEIQLHYEVLK